MSDCSTLSWRADDAYEAGIESLTNDIHKLQNERDTLEQRYQQLEQVAKEMLKELEHCEWEPWFEDIPIKFRNRLSELGVNIDD